MFLQRKISPRDLSKMRKWNWKKRSVWLTICRWLLYTICKHNMNTIQVCCSNERNFLSRYYSPITHILYDYFLIHENHSFFQRHMKLELWAYKQCHILIVSFYFQKSCFIIYLIMIWNSNTWWLQKYHFWADIARGTSFFTHD